MPTFNTDTCIEFTSQVVQINGLKTNTNTQLGGTLAVTGATTLSSTLNVTGATSFTVAPTGPSKFLTNNSAAAGATVVLTAAQSGQIFINASSSGSPKWTLPAVANGLEFAFICGNTTAGFVVNCADAAVIHVKTSASGTVLTTTATTGTLINTQATAIVGDFIDLVCDGVSWYMIGISGIYSVT